jgi:AraC-like DNA-binding protein
MKFSEYREQYQDDMNLEQIVEVFFSDALDADDAFSMDDLEKETGLSRKSLDQILRGVKEDRPAEMPAQRLTAADAVLTFLRIHRGFVHEKDILGIAPATTIDEMVKRGRLMSWGEGYYSLPDVEPPRHLVQKFKKILSQDLEIKPEDRVVSWIERQGRVAWTLDDIAQDCGLSARITKQTVNVLIKEQRVEFIEEVAGQRFYKGTGE